jgi:hypothetical protein
MIVSFSGEFRWLSNFASVKIILDGIEFSSTEHAYMSAKSESMEWKSFCACHTNSAGQVKRKSKTISLVENWDEIKVSVMKDCIQQKFSQEPFRTKLLQTNDEIIEEGNSWNDKFWGVDIKTRVGENILGKLIMEFRDSLINKD